MLTVNTHHFKLVLLELDSAFKGKLKKVSLECENEKIYQDLQTREIYIQAILDYISGMTDRFIISLFNELLEY